jgi:drug/metabolite transporter (DMT)-like permease
MYEVYILIFAGLIGALMYGIEAFILKYTLNMSSVSGSVYALYSTIFHFIVGVIVVFILRKNVLLNLEVIFLFITAGLLLGISFYGYYYLMNRDSASTILQLASLESVSTPIAGIIILNESFSILSLIGISSIIIGILIISINRGIKENIKRAVLPMIGIIFLWSLTDVLLKTGLAYTDFIVAYFWSRLGMVIILLIKPSQLRGMKKVVDIHSVSEHLLYIFGSLCSSVGIYLTLFTYAELPISIANPIISTYPIMLLIIISVFRNLNIIDIEPETNLLKKFISSLLFILGVYILTISI